MSSQMERFNESLVGRYTIEREIGRGGMATVYLATDQKHGRQVAVKVILPSIAYSISGERFLREIEIAARLAHPNILPLLDSGQANGFLYHVTPYMEGETLGKRLKRERELPIADSVQIAREIADALDYAHSEGIVHRDVKPENIILSRGHALIADFGVARAIEVGGGESLTETGIVLGTPAYMSPEQASAERSLDGRSDIYSLACVVYEMLGGEPPLMGRTSVATMARRLNESPTSLRVVRQSVHPGMEEVVHKALSRLPADRYGRANEFADALAATLSGAATPAARRVDAPPVKPSFWAELKRRKVYSVGAVYVVVAWLLVQIADTAFQ
ncbi:MAG: serine/threonine-protein kinase, partial [Gemmatimonadota bacterium]